MTTKSKADTKKAPASKARVREETGPPSPHHPNGKKPRVRTVHVLEGVPAPADPVGPLDEMPIQIVDGDEVPTNAWVVETYPEGSRRVVDEHGQHRILMNRNTYLKMMANIKPAAAPPAGPLRPVGRVAQVDTDWFKERLTAQEMSMRGLARNIGLDVAAVSLMLNGKRKMSVQEAGAIASQLNVSVEEVLKRAGVERLGAREAMAEVIGWADGAGVIHPGRGNGPAAIKGPGEGFQAIRVESGRMAGWTVFIQGMGAPRVGPEAVGALCLVDAGQGERLAWVDRGWEPGEYRVTGIDGAEKIGKIISASPVVWARQ